MISFAVYIRLKIGSPEGVQDFPSVFTVPVIVDMHYNGYWEVVQDDREGKVLRAVCIRLEEGCPEVLQDFIVPGSVDIHTITPERSYSR